MAKHDKTIESLKTRPIPADIKWADVVSLLKPLDFEELKGRGSRRKFYNREKDCLIICHEPHPSPNIDKGCATDIFETLKKNKLI